MKTRRHAKILELIKEHDIDTQDELLRYLRESGFDVTQATVSRDIKELRLVKALSPTGNYYYTLPMEKQPEVLSLNIDYVFLESIKSVDFAGNFVVVKCFPGMANAVCVAVDTGTWDGLVGTIAGDDTIMCAIRSVEDTIKVMDKIGKIV